MDCETDCDMLWLSDCDFDAAMDRRLRLNLRETLPDRLWLCDMLIESEREADMLMDWDKL